MASLVQGKILGRVVIDNEIKQQPSPIVNGYNINDACHRKQLIEQHPISGTTKSSDEDNAQLD